jgi:hypothetical protein
MMANPKGRINAMNRFLPSALRKALREADTEYDNFVSAIAFFKARGIDFNWVPRRGFRFWKWVGNRPQMAILWTSPALTREYLDAPSTLISVLNQIEQEALSNGA